MAKAFWLMGLAGAVLLSQHASASADDTFHVAPQTIGDEKAVFATVESRRIVPARARIGGTVAELASQEGDRVELGQVIATVGDEKFALQMKSLDAQIAGLAGPARPGPNRSRPRRGSVRQGHHPKTRLDEARTGLQRRQQCDAARTAERSVIEQQFAEGNVLAPAAGRVLKVPLTTGTVVLPGDPVADRRGTEFRSAAAGARASCRLPEGRRSRPHRWRRSRQVGARFGTIHLVYPQIQDGRVVADAVVEGLGDYFVGERIRVWISAGDRTAFIVPEPSSCTRFGMDYVRIRTGRRDRDRRAGAARSRTYRARTCPTRSKSCPV